MISQTGFEAASPYFFRETIPDDVPTLAPEAIRAMTDNFDADRLEVIVIETGNHPGFFVTDMVFLNKARDDGYYFRGLVDPQGYHILFPRAKDVMDALRMIADEYRVELDISVHHRYGGGARLHREPNFFEQLKNDHVGWHKNNEPKRENPLNIPSGSDCSDCPYYQTIPGKPEQSDGYCAYLEFGDWMCKLGFSLLWEGIKVCSINTD